MIPTKETIEKSLRLLITSTIYTVTENTDLNEEDRDSVINLQFNMMVNMLSSEYALLFIDEMLKISGHIEMLEEIERKEVIEEIFTKMREP